MHVLYKNRFEERWEPWPSVIFSHLIVYIIGMDLELIWWFCRRIVVCCLPLQHATCQSHRTCNKKKHPTRQLVGKQCRAQHTNTYKLLQHFQRQFHNDIGANGMSQSLSLFVCIVAAIVRFTLLLFPSSTAFARTHENRSFLMNTMSHKLWTNNCYNYFNTFCNVLSKELLFYWF